MRIYFSHLLKISTESITFTKESIDITVSHCIFNLIEEVFDISLLSCTTRVEDEVIAQTTIKLALV